jgi:hypothetical protein
MAPGDHCTLKNGKKCSHILTDDICILPCLLFTTQILEQIYVRKKCSNICLPYRKHTLGYFCNKVIYIIIKRRSNLPQWYTYYRNSKYYKIFMTLRIQNKHSESEQNPEQNTILFSFLCPIPSYSFVSCTYITMYSIHVRAVGYHFLFPLLQH